MRVRRKTIWGKINSNGELEVRLADLDEFCRMHPNRSIILRAEIQSKEPSSKLKAYFFGYVIKEVQRAFYDAGEDYTEEQTYNRIRAVCPLFLSEERVETQGAYTAVTSVSKRRSDRSVRSHTA